MNLTTAPQRGVFASFATIRTLTNIFIGSVALMFAMTATADILGTTGTSPNGIAIDADGNVYTANASSNNVSKITPDGTSTIFAATGTGTLPEGIALDAAGNVYTANSGSNNVSKILAPVAATPVPTSPLWLLGMMAGLLSLVAVRKLRKA